MDGLNYASGDASLIEVTEKLGFLKDLVEKQAEINEKLLNSLKKPKKEGVFTGFEKARISETKFMTAGIAGLGAVMGIIPAIPGLLATASDIAGYFRTDYTIKGKEISLDKEALMSSVAGHLGSYGMTSYIQNFYSLYDSVKGSQVLKNYTEIQKMLMDLSEKKTKLEYYSGSDAEKENSKTKGKKGTEEDTGKDSGEDPAQKTIRTAIKNSDTIINESKTIIQEISAAADADKTSKLMKALLREKEELFGITHILCVNVAQSGGEIITKKKLLGRTDNMGCTGGAAVSYILAEKTGKIVSSGIVSAMFTLDFSLSGRPETKLREINLC
ncbi:hypothetical protein J2128_002204 [Methanomicrobium sp. W14]|uniref:hypothetical protein n=1 Tax=Methanomicrobium sp. W14 TaxID=2817839 RepID=UPI001AE27AF3|nr:hypothetical protein [Methanomicrobium sp. W14]MBP2134238.1 hypothetical protein [Methanomicrobium sp. W14]